MPLFTTIVRAISKQTKTRDKLITFIKIIELLINAAQNIVMEEGCF